MKQTRSKKLGVWPEERYDEGSFHIARLADTGIGAASPGETFRVYVGRHDLGKVAEVVSVEEKRFRELSGEDGARILRAPANGVRDLQLRLESLYAFRPRWRGDDSLVRIISLGFYESTTQGEVSMGPEAGSWDIRQRLAAQATQAYDGSK